MEKTSFKNIKVGNINTPMIFIETTKAGDFVIPGAQKVVNKDGKLTLLGSVKVDIEDTPKLAGSTITKDILEDGKLMGDIQITNEDFPQLTGNIVPPAEMPHLTGSVAQQPDENKITGDIVLDPDEIIKYDPKLTGNVIMDNTYSMPTPIIPSNDYSLTGGTLIDPALILETTNEINRINAQIQEIIKSNETIIEKNKKIYNSIKNNFIFNPEFEKLSEQSKYVTFLESFNTIKTNIESSKDVINKYLMEKEIQFAQDKYSKKENYFSLRI